MPFAAEACRTAAARLAARLVPPAELLRAVPASVRQEQHSAYSLPDEQHPTVAQLQDGPATSAQALPLVLKASLPQAEPPTELRAAPDALPAALQRPASQLAWSSPLPRLSASQLQRLPERGNAFLLFQPGHGPANSNASFFR